MFRRIPGLIWLLLCLSTASHLMAGSDTLAPLDIDASSTEITVRGGQPNGKILIVGYVRPHSTYTFKTHRHRAFLSADGTGTVTLRPEGGVPADSVWVAVDVRSGRYGALSSGSTPSRTNTMSASSFRRDGNEPGKRLVSELPKGYFVLVRPNEGAWELDAGDGGQRDRDGQVDGKTEVSPEDFHAVTAGPSAPDRFRAGDLVLAFSPGETAFSFIRLDGDGGAR